MPLLLKDSLLYNDNPPIELIYVLDFMLLQIEITLS